ncbi:MAG: aspartate-semialdehyde dehydrogenase [Peptostreptococcaceae bacterium]|nr:aspartate-semialdehyde dehydrogenase [Peptostreptococcaceae bacterium]
MKKTNIAILGATGMVGQRFIQLLENHPYFDVKVLAASASSEGKSYQEAVRGRWNLKSPMPNYVKDMIVEDVHNLEKIVPQVELVLCALDMDKQAIVELEEKYAKAEVIVVSNNSANRWTKDVPMIIPELNKNHIEIVEAQKKRLGTKKGFIAVKPNCSIQSYVPMLFALRDFGLKEVVVSTYQAISGAGKTFDTWSEMVDNVIPFIGGEEEKSEKEPLRILGEVGELEILPASEPIISAQCIRVPVSDGHLATVSVKFDKKPSREEILARWKNFETAIDKLNLPSAPKPFIVYFEEDNRPQTKLEREAQKGMQVSAGRLREDSIFDYRFVGLSHNTLRGAAGGALLVAEMIKAMGYLD